MFPARPLLVLAILLAASATAPSSVTSSVAQWAGCYELTFAEWASARPGVHVPSGTRVFRLQTAVAEHREDDGDDGIVRRRARQISGPGFEYTPPVAPVWNEIRSPAGGFALEIFDGFSGLTLHVVPDSAGLAGTATLLSDELVPDSSGVSSTVVASAGVRARHVACPSRSNATALPTTPDTLPFSGCWTFAWDSRAGLWDAPLPRELMLLSQHADPHPDDAEYREARLAYYREPVPEGFSDRDLLFRHNTIWSLVGSDSLRVLLSWQAPAGPPRYELRALGTSERLDGTLGVQLRAGFDSLLTFTATRETCPADGVLIEGHPARQ